MTLAPPRTPIGIRIRRKRIAAGLSQAALARVLGISASYLNLIENNKRAIGGKLLLRIGERLGIDLEHLSGESETRAIAAIGELMADPVMAGIELEPAAARELVARFPEAGAALARLYRAHADASAEIEVLQHRLQSDPFLSQLLHQILNRIAGIRSGAAILADIPDLTESERGRFVATINGEARDLVPTVQRLAAYFDQTARRQKSVSPMGEVDEALIAHGNHFPALEEAADDLRAELGQEFGTQFGTRDGLHEPALAQALERRFGIVCRVEAAAPQGEGLDADILHLPAQAADVLRLPAQAPGSTRIFRMLRVWATRAAAPVIDDTARTLDLTSDEARRLARRALSSYVAGAVMMPYGDFLAMAEERRYDLELLSGLTGAGIEQVAHRLVTLRRRGAEGVPFGFLRTDPAGRLTKRFPLPNLTIPAAGHGCPLWPIYRAFAVSGVVRQVSTFPGGGRFLLLAKAVSKQVAGFHDQPRTFSIMLACDMLHADRTVYGQGLDAHHPAVEVGPSCMLCPRLQCAHRHEMPV